MIFRTLRNASLFITLAIKQNTPIELWGEAWENMEAEHQAQIRKEIWELKRAGKVREDAKGRLWWVGDE